SHGVGGGVAGRPTGAGRAAPALPPAGIDGLAAARQEPQSDLRLGRIQRLAVATAAPVGDAHDPGRVARLVVDVGAVDPRMAGLPARGALRAHDDRRRPDLLSAHPPIRPPVCPVAAWPPRAGRYVSARAAASWYGSGAGSRCSA